MPRENWSTTQEAIFQRAMAGYADRIARYRNQEARRNRRASANPPAAQPMYYVASANNGRK